MTSYKNSEHINTNINVYQTFSNDSEIVLRYPKVAAGAQII